MALQLLNSLKGIYPEVGIHPKQVDFSVIFVMM